MKNSVDQLGGDGSGSIAHTCGGRRRPVRCSLQRFVG